MQPFVLIVASDSLSAENLSEILTGHGLRTISAVKESIAIGILYAIKIDLVVFKESGQVAQWQRFVNEAKNIQPKLRVLVFGEVLLTDGMKMTDDIIVISDFSKEKINSAISKLVRA